MYLAQMMVAVALRCAAADERSAAAVPSEASLDGMAAVEGSAASPAGRLQSQLLRPSSDDAGEERPREKADSATDNAGEKRGDGVVDEPAQQPGGASLDAGIEADVLEKPSPGNATAVHGGSSGGGGAREPMTQAQQVEAEEQQALGALGKTSGPPSGSARGAPPGDGHAQVGLGRRCPPHHCECSGSFILSQSSVSLHHPCFALCLFASFRPCSTG